MRTYIWDTSLVYVQFQSSYHVEAASVPFLCLMLKPSQIKTYKKYTHTSQLVRMPQLWQQKDRQISQGVWRAHISALHDDTITIICNTSKQLILASCYIDKHFTMQTSSSVSREGCEVKKCAASEPSRINTFTTVILANTPTLHPENHAHVVCTYV